ncbi:MAG: hypothetical protein QG597_589 [Actinomycetota bacterium]|nr:hypothetical protein [Actinomycetota bacterium]
MTDPWQPGDVRTKQVAEAGKATPAYVYAYWLGGKDNYAADRAVGDAVAREHPGIVAAVKANRTYMVDIVAYMARTGIRQFLDIGAGLPISPNVHDVAQRVDPSCRVVYVDNDPVVLTHGRALMRAGGVHMLDGDMTRPGDILDQVEAQGLLDLTRPVGLLLIAALHFVTDDPTKPDDPTASQIVHALTARLAPGSLVAISHTWDDEGPLGEAVRAAVEEYSTAAVPFRARTTAEIEALFDGLDPVAGLHQLTHKGRPVTVLASLARVCERP